MGRISEPKGQGLEDHHQVALRRIMTIGHWDLMAYEIMHGLSEAEEPARASSCIIETILRYKLCQLPPTKCDVHRFVCSTMAYTKSSKSLPDQSFLLQAYQFHPERLLLCLWLISIPQQCKNRFPSFKMSSSVLTSAFSPSCTNSNFKATYRASQPNPLVYAFNVDVFLCVRLYLMAIHCDLIECCNFLEYFCFWTWLFLLLFVCEI